MGKKNTTISSHLSFRNSQGVAAEGTLVSLSRQMVVFEVYNPYSIVQLSEVLRELVIHQGERATYSGRAVITGLMNTGLILIVSASLVDPWNDLAELGPGELLRSYVRDFVHDWDEANARVGTRYRVAVTNLRNYLQELRRWLEHWETEAGIDGGTHPDRLAQFVRDVDHETAPRFEELNGEFESATSEIARRDIPFHRALAQRDLHPLLMASPFMNRAFNKPLGYAGDYQMVNMMLGEPWQGKNTFAKIVNASALRHDAPAAHRNRIEILQSVLSRETARVLNGEPRRVEFLNIGCGPADEIQRFAKSDASSEHVDFDLVDFNEETLQYVTSVVIPNAQQSRPGIGIQTQQKSVHEILKLSQEGTQLDESSARYDVVYCAGLFDYFRNATCGYLIELFYQWIRPGGVVVVSNVTPHHSSIGMMGLVLDWNLELRSEQTMRQLCPGLGQQTSYVDDTSVNAFLEIRKPLP